MYAREVRQRAALKRMENNSENSESPKLIKYGELIVLGYNGADNHSLRNGHGGKKHQSKMELRRRIAGNGIKKAKQSNVSEPRASQAVQDRSRHTVSYTYSRNQTVIVEYQEDRTTDMFQIGRSSEPQIDFTVVDTWLAAGIVSQDQNGSLRAIIPDQQSPNGLGRQFSSTISRYACRILCEREGEWSGDRWERKVRVFAAGFDASRNIFLGEKATKWRKKNGEVDGLTTNGILVLHPSPPEEEQTDLHSMSMEGTHNEGSPSNLLNNQGLPQSSPVASVEQGEGVGRQISNGSVGGGTGSMYVWREVSVDGDIYTLRETRSAQKRGDLHRDETNELKDGTLIDLCGATLLYRTMEGLESSPSRQELELMLDDLNAGKPQCPVNLNTLVVPRRRGQKLGAAARHLSHAAANGAASAANGGCYSAGSMSERQPWVYIKCGHVQGKHSWGHVQSTGENGENSKHKCPICNQESDRMLQLTMGMEPAFHLDSGILNYAFNPCGHMASMATVRYWSRIPLPHGTNSFHPVCPFCTSLLAEQQPFLKLIFQDHCDA